MSGPYQRQDLSNCGAEMLHVGKDCGILRVKIKKFTIFVTMLALHELYLVSKLFQEILYLLFSLM